MAKFLLICRKEDTAPLLSPELGAYISSQIIPDNITPNPAEILAVDENLEYAIINPVSIVGKTANAVCLGAAFADDGVRWDKPFDPKPIGSFSLFRFDAGHVELVTDMVASQTIWYYHDNSTFIASTSQRAILLFLNGFELNRDVLPWMLSTGTLGPGFAWDKRLKSVSPDGTVVLDRENWKVTATTPEIGLNIQEGELAYHRNLTDEVLEETIGSMSFPEDKWVISLSGGYDSRALLLYLHNRRKIKCVTWGLSNVLDHHLSDAYVARSLTEHFNLPFRFFTLDAKVSFETLFNRFFTASDGRTDHIAGYSDGLDLWRQLFESGVEGMLRADQVYETKNIHSIEDTIKVNGIIGLDQYSNTRIFEKYGLAKLTWPEGLWLKQGESLIDWSARLYHSFRLPYLQAALNTIKTCYLEMCSPFLSRPVIENAYSLPDEYRFKKVLFKEIVTLKTPDIPFATYNASHKIADLIATPEAVAFIERELKAGLNKHVLPDEILQFLISRLRIANSDLNKKSEKKKFLKGLKERLGIKNIKSFGKKALPAEINLNLVAFRAVLCLRAAKDFSTHQSKTESMIYQ
ncbi:MAG: hypothetical protein R3C61_10820 [Bacteroidia bacterium]